MIVLENDSRDSLELKYSDESQKIVKYLTTLISSRLMNRKNLRKFKLKTLKFLIKEKHLFKWVNKNMSLRRVINDDEDREKIVRFLHDESEHKNKKKRIKKSSIDIDERINENKWRNMFKVAMCINEEKNREKKKLYIRFKRQLFNRRLRWIAYTCLLSKKKIIVIKCDLSKWVKIRGISNFKIETIAKFL